MKTLFYGGYNVAGKQYYITWGEDVENFLIADMNGPIANTPLRLSCMSKRGVMLQRRIFQRKRDKDND